MSNNRRIGLTSQIKLQELNKNPSDKIGIMQSYFFPYIGYFQLINETKRFVIYEHLTFRKQSWISRNRILEKGNAEPVYVRVPLKKQSSNKTIGDLMIDNSQSWRDYLLNQVWYNYKKSKFFEETYENLKDWIFTDSESLHQYNAEIIKKICKNLGIESEIISQNEYGKEIEDSLLEKAEKNNLPIKNQRVVELCKYHGFNTYLNPIGGTELYQKKDFSKLGYDLMFIKTVPFEYNQFNQPFISHLSIIDVLFHTGIEGAKSLLQHFEIQ